MVHLVLAIPVPQIQEQIVAGQGVHFAKVLSTIDARQQASASERSRRRTRNHSSKRKEQPQAQPLPSQHYHHKKKKTRIPSNAKQRDKRTGTRTSTCKRLQRYRRSAARNIYTGHLGTRRPRQPWMRPKPANLVQALTANMLAHHLCVVC